MKSDSIEDVFESCVVDLVESDLIPRPRIYSHNKESYIRVNLHHHSLFSLFSIELSTLNNCLSCGSIFWNL
ncbi:hypothetical protein RDI58_026695 [Solanum bulbocastanum]|uniref:Uncharacterized protein n=1 Tax=Solanum bulbocastanum TaxID=147425 RepID=A0AAN8SUB1_SOLBU